MICTVDPRIELLGALQYMSKYPQYSGLPLLDQTFSDYHNAVSDYFSPYKDHIAVMQTQKLVPKGLRFDTAIDLVLRATKPPELNLYHPLPYELFSRLDNQMLFSDYLTVIKDFAIVTDFLSFYDQHLPLYCRILEKFKALTGHLAWEKELQHFLGEELAEFSIILSPILPGYYATEIQNKSKTYAVFGIGENSIRHISDVRFLFLIAWYELLRSRVSVITRKKKTMVDASERLFSVVEDDIGLYGYDMWAQFLNELIVRGIADRLAFHYFGYEYYQKLIQKERSEGFLFIDTVCNIVESHDSNGVLDVSLDQCHTEILEKLRLIAIDYPYPVDPIAHLNAFIESK